MVTINTTTIYDVLSCMGIFHLIVNENNFSICDILLKDHVKYNHSKLQ